MEQVTLNKETYDRLMDIELSKMDTIDKLRDNVKQLQQDGVSVEIYSSVWRNDSVKLYTKDEKVKAMKDQMQRDCEATVKVIDKIYNRNILQRIFNKRV